MQWSWVFQRFGFGANTRSSLLILFFWGTSARSYDVRICSICMYVFSIHPFCAPTGCVTARSRCSCRQGLQEFWALETHSTIHAAVGEGRFSTPLSCTEVHCRGAQRNLSTHETDKTLSGSANSAPPLPDMDDGSRCSHKARH